uniref:Uncharacterized protein n=1 Tax=Arundo donax TaxID=35708 RepID=A0A0A9DS97_ARUDO
MQHLILYFWNRFEVSWHLLVFVFVFVYLSFLFIQGLLLACLIFCM